MIKVFIFRLCEIQGRSILQHFTIRSVA